MQDDMSRYAATLCKTKCENICPITDETIRTKDNQLVEKCIVIDQKLLTLDSVIKPIIKKEFEYYDKCFSKKITDKCNIITNIDEQIFCLEKKISSLRQESLDIKYDLGLKFEKITDKKIDFINNDIINYHMLLEKIQELKLGDFLNINFQCPCLYRHKHKNDYYYCMCPPIEAIMIHLKNQGYNPEHTIDVNMCVDVGCIVHVIRCKNSNTEMNI